MFVFILFHPLLDVNSFSLFLFLFPILYDTILSKSISYGGSIMDFKKCTRCGGFHMTLGTVCPNCENGNKFDGVNADSFISGNPEIHGINGFGGNTTTL